MLRVRSEGTLRPLTPPQTRQLTPIRHVPSDSWGDGSQNFLLLQVTEINSQPSLQPLGAHYLACRLFAVFEALLFSGCSPPSLLPLVSIVGLRVQLRSPPSSARMLRGVCRGSAGTSSGYTLSCCRLTSAACGALISDLCYYLHSKTVKDKRTQNQTIKFTRKMPRVLIYGK